MKHRILLLVLALFLSLSTVLVAVPAVSSALQPNASLSVSSSSIMPQSFAASSTPDNSTLKCSLDGLSANPFEMVGNALNWLLCPFIKLIGATVNTLDGMINSQLSIGSDGNSSNPNQIFASASGECGSKTRDGGDVCNAYHTAWSSFRNLALGIIVIAGLFVLISQALGMELLDAYTIRKVLPRLLLATVGISISWQLMQFAVEFTNSLGYGVRYLIYSPFNELSTAGQLKINIKDFAAAYLLGVPGWGLLGGVGFSTLLGTALLALLVAFFVLILRQIAVIMLIIFAPIAIACYVLPNTQKYYKFWWESFSKALLMFPIIAGIIATGRVFSAVSLAQSDSLLSHIIGFSAYFAPYFLIPFTFRFAGGAIAQIGGFVNDRSRGGFDMLRNVRKQNTAKRFKAARSGGIYRNDSTAGRWMNRQLDRTLDGDEYWRYRAGEIAGDTRAGRALGLARYRDITDDQISGAQLEHSMKAAQDLSLHYQSGRALGGQLQYFAAARRDASGNIQYTTDAQGRRVVDWDMDAGDRDLGPQQRNALVENFGVFDDSGNWTGEWRGPNGLNEVQTMAEILQTGGESSAIAGQELHAKAGDIGNFKAHDDTRRADIQTVGLLAAAQAGRLEGNEIAGTYNSAMSDGSSIEQHFATKRTAMLQRIASQKRADLREGHGIQYQQVNGQMQARSIYEDPTHRRAQDAIMSLTVPEISSSKSETIDAIENTLRYGASREQMRVEMQDGEQVVTSTGQLKTGEALERADAMRNRLRYLITYSSGDADMERKLRRIADDLGVDIPPPDASEAARLQQAAQQQGAQQQQNQQGGPGQQGGGTPPNPLGG